MSKVVRPYPLNEYQRKQKIKKDLKKRLKESEKQFSKVADYDTKVLTSWIMTINHLLQNQIVIMAALLDE